MRSELNVVCFYLGFSEGSLQCWKGCGPTIERGAGSQWKDAVATDEKHLKSITECGLL